MVFFKGAYRNCQTNLSKSNLFRNIVRKITLNICKKMSIKLKRPSKKGCPKMGVRKLYKKICRKRLVKNDHQKDLQKNGCQKLIHNQSHLSQLHFWESVQQDVDSCKNKFLITGLTKVRIFQNSTLTRIFFFIFSKWHCNAPMHCKIHFNDNS